MFDKKKIRKSMIAKAGLKLINQRGYLQMSFSELAKEVGVPTGTLYRTFPSKDDLLVFLFGEFISKLNESMMRFSKMELSAKEKLICYHCYQFYLRKKINDRNALDLLATNHILFESAKPETKAIFKKVFDEAAQFQRDTFIALKAKGQIAAEPETIKRALRQLVLVSRGGMFVSNHIFIDQSTFQVEDMVGACSMILDQLQWQGDHGRTDHRLIMLALGSEYEQSHSKAW